MTPANFSSTVDTASAGPQGNDGHSPAISGGRKNDPNGRDLTEIATIVSPSQMDQLIATVKSLEGTKTETMQAELLWYEQAVGKAARLYQLGDIDKKKFRLAVRSLDKDTWACIAFCQMSDELRIHWITEKAKEGGGPTSNTKA